MAGVDWTDEAFDLAVADYFAMLSCDLRGVPYVKARHRRALAVRVGHSEGSLEYLHRNISAILRAMGEEWIAGYRPAVNYALGLEAAVARWLAAHPEWMMRVPSAAHVAGLRESPVLWLGVAPTLRNAPEGKEEEQARRVARKFDAAGRDARNRDLGRRGEACVLAHERAVLRGAGREDLAARVRWVSDLDGDGAGYDIASFAPDGQARLIEVKTTRGWERTPFHISANELEVSRERAGDWCLMRLWNFDRAPQAFELRPPLEAHVSLVASSYLARFA